jgi:hypothetical protein
LFDLDHVLTYSKDDLERAKRDLTEARDILFGFGAYLNLDFMKKLLTNRVTGKAMDKISAGDIRAQFLAWLNEFRLFQEAMDRIAGGTRTPGLNGQKARPEYGLFGCGCWPGLLLDFPA